MRLSIVAAIAGGIIAVAVLAMFASTIPTQDYSLSVDALKDDQSLFTNARVVLTNTGRHEITNIVIDYGKTQERIDVLAPGKKVFSAPPEGTVLDSVTVTADNGIQIVQPYRAPVKLPGMIGS